MTIEALAPMWIDASYSSARTMRQIAVAVQAADVDDYICHAVEEFAERTWSGRVQALSADAALLDVFMRIRREADRADRMRFLVDLPSKSPLWVHQNAVRAALGGSTVPPI